MNSIQERFSQLKRANPYWSSYTSFAEAIKGKRYTKRRIALWFNCLVEKEDYSSKDKKAILEYLQSL